MSSHLTGLAVGVLGFTLGFGVFKLTGETLNAARDPASVQGKVFQISTLNSDQIKAYIQNKLNVGRTVNGTKEISFSGFSAGICKTYSSIELELVAEGVSVAGEPPVLKIKTPCEANPQEPADMANLVLPIELLLKEKPENKEYQFTGYKTSMALENTADAWPQTWVVRKVEFKNTQGTDTKEAYFGRAPASAETARPIVLEF